MTAEASVSDSDVVWSYVLHRCTNLIIILFYMQVCGIQLTLKTFSRAKDATGADNQLKEIYCRTHQPWQGAGTFGGDAVEIKRALRAQEKASHSVSSLLGHNSLIGQSMVVNFSRRIG